MSSARLMRLASEVLLAKYERETGQAADDAWTAAAIARLEAMNG